MSQTASALSIHDVSVSYGKTPIVRNISLDVLSGEIFGLIGLNGAGKTTLIKAVFGLRRCSGVIRVEGRDHRHSDIRKRLAYLPERFDPPWFLSGIEFIKFSLSLYKKPFDLSAANESSQRLGLDPAVLPRRVQTYSKGMRQKLGLLATFLTGAPLLVLDEPMSGLDPQARANVKDLFVEIRKAGRTIFMSSHILSDMNEICDRVSVLNGGSLIYTGTPRGLCEKGGNENMERAFLNIINPASLRKAGDSHC